MHGICTLKWYLLYRKYEMGHFCSAGHIIIHYGSAQRQCHTCFSIVECQSKTWYLMLYSMLMYV